jgi:serine/threonine-protein kinase
VGTLRRGDKLGRFIIQEDLGYGGMGGVFIGEDEQTGEAVAVKTLHARFSVDQAMVARFVREAEAYRKMNHPNVVRYLSSGLQDGIYFIVVEYVKGMSLEDIMEKVGGPLGVKRSTLVAADLLSALEHAHARNLIHRDIKPKNIMLSSKGEVKLLDFGVAAADDQLVKTRVGSILGSFRYSSPEQNQGQKVDERSDLYSLGLVYWEMLTGRRALLGESLLKVTTAQLMEGVPPPSSLNPEVPVVLDSLCGALLTKSSLDRCPSASHALDVLRPFLEGLD